MSEITTPQRDSKRQSLKTLLGSVAVGAVTIPESWSKPLISSVLLPAHGVVTDCPGCVPISTFEFNGPSIENFNLLAGIEAGGAILCEVPVSLEVGYDDESREGHRTLK